MFTIGRYNLHRCIYKSNNSIVYDGIDSSTHMSVVLKTTNTNLFNANSLSQLRNEHHILSKIQSPFVPKVLDFIKDENDFYIVSEHCTGITISEYISKHKVSILEFLHIAGKIVRGLADIHDADIIHKGINPSNIIYNPQSRTVHLVGFGISTAYFYEKPLSFDLNSSDRTLYYISPEQTGRTNYSVDFRTDFYSLGVTFFEMLCGCRPFESASPTEIIFSHLAKTPPSAKEVNPQVPEMLSSIIAKLMAKMPEDRYSSAAGILFDLNQCLKNLETNYKIIEFKLGEEDYSERLELPHKIYGREKEISDLLAAFHSIVNGGNALITIGGYSGVGKTSLVSELHRPIIESNGLFIEGKFDQYHRNMPYFAFFQAIDHFCNVILSENEKIIDLWKAKISNALGQDGKLLVDKAPHLALLAGKQRDLPKLSPIEERTIIKTIIKNLIATAASPQQPLVLFIDDIHLADMGSLEIVEEIMSDDKISGLLVVSCYRDNEVDNNHPLIISLNKMKNRQAYVQNIVLSGLTLSSVEQMLADTLHCKAGSSAELTEIVYHRTGGNPFYVKQFLKFCQKNGYIFFNRTRKAWDWDLELVKTCSAEENVVDFLIRNADQLSSQTRRLLSLGACIGRNFTFGPLTVLLGRGIEEISSAIKQAVALEIIYPVQSKSRFTSETGFVFSHDRFQQTFYTILSESERSNIHRALAYYYEKTGESDNQAETLFNTADNYSKAFGIIDELFEKRRVAKILLKAANSASLLSAFDTAVHYLEQIINDFSADHQYDHDFVFSVYCEYHSVLCSLARYEEADSIYAIVASLAKEPLRLTDSGCLQAISLSNRGKYKDAFALGVELLEKLGVHFPAEDLRNTLAKEIDIFYSELGKEGFPGVEELPVADNLQEFAIGKILNRICTAALFYNPLYAFWAIITNAKRVLENGYTPDGLPLYGSLTLVLIPFRNDYKLSYDLARSAMTLGGKNGYRLFRMYHLFSLINCHWFQDLENSISYARESCRGNITVGDFEFACFTFFTTQQVVLETCENIDELVAESDSALAFAAKHGNLHAIGSFTSFRQLCQALKNKRLPEGSFNDEHFDEATHLGQVSTNPMALVFFCTLRALAAVIYLDFDTAFELTEKAIPLMPSVTGFYATALYKFLHSLSICKRIENQKCTEEEKSALLKKLSANQTWLGERAADAPVNFQHLYDLIEAERYMLERQGADSLTGYKTMLALYEKAMTGAADSKRFYHYALACELAGIQFMKLDTLRSATVYLKEAYSAYLSWGATAKTEQMSERYGELKRLKFNNLKFREDPAVISQTPPNVNTNAGIFSTISSAIDFAAIIKASQAIAGETKLEAILERLISVLLENSGAQDIYYLTKSENGCVIQAEGHSEGKTVLILHDQPVGTDNFPIRIFQYAQRAHESVILDNATNSEMYGNDEYILSHRCKSVMCMPVINKGVLKGILYLENNLIEGVFDKQRAEVLKTIASQLAISLENSYLYANLQQLVDERTHELRAEIAIRKSAEERLEQMAKHDPLTHLPNRRMFQEILSHSIEIANLNKRRLGVVFVDLDGFKSINDTYGHDKGDVVLVATAQRLVAAVRSSDTVSRLGGDEFVLILENINTLEEIQIIINRIINSVREPILIDEQGTQTTVTTSIGISLLPFDGNSDEALINNADKAMYIAKNNGKNQFVFFSKQYQL